MSSVRKEKFRLQCYLASQIDSVWSFVRPLVERALETGSNYTIDEVYDGLKTKRMQLWTWGEDAALVTSIQTDDVTFCLLLAIGGKDMAVWLKYLPLVEEWAREQGATELRIYGRRGWTRLEGFEHMYTKLRKPL